jgi:hypothetical protein
VSPVKYELVFYTPQEDILYSHCRETLKSYIIKHSVGRVYVTLLCDFVPVMRGRKVDIWFRVHFFLFLFLDPGEIGVMFFRNAY